MLPQHTCRGPCYCIHLLLLPLFLPWLDRRDEALLSRFDVDGSGAAGLTASIYNKGSLSCLCISAAHVVSQSQIFRVTKPQLVLCWASMQDTAQDLTALSPLHHYVPLNAKLSNSCFNPSTEGGAKGIIENTHAL